MPDLGPTAWKQCLGGISSRAGPGPRCHALPRSRPGVPLGHNPFAKELEAKNAQLEGLRERRAKLVSDLGWHRDFDRAAAAQTVEIDEATCAALELELDDVTRELASGRKEGKKLHSKAKVGMNPAYWFSIDRHAAKVRGAELYGVLVDLEKREKELHSRVPPAQGALQASSQTLAKFDEFDAGATKAEIARLDVETPRLQLELHDLAERKTALDRQLEEPLKVLNGLQEEERRVARAQARCGAGSMTSSPTSTAPPGSIANFQALPTGTSGTGSMRSARTGWAMGVRGRSWATDGGS